MYASVACYFKLNGLMCTVPYIETHLNVDASLMTTAA